MHYLTLPILAIATLATAAPAPEVKSDQWKGVIDPWGQYGHTPGKVKRTDIVYPNDDTNTTTFRIEDREFSSEELLSLAKRSTIKDFAGKIPGCDDDPSNKNVPKPNWKVNEGVKIPKNKGWKDDACTSGHGANHCWTEYYLVEAAVEYFSWLPTGSAVNCPAAAKSSCSVQVQSLVQSCSVTGTTSSEGWDWKVIDASGTIKVDLGRDGVTGGGDFSLGGGYSKNKVETNHDLTNVCRADSSAVTCTWANDSGEAKNLCHQVWYADRVLHVFGQAQRVCNKCAGDGDVQQNTGDNKVCVRGQKEFNFRLPINKLVHCDGSCGANEPGVNQPENGPRGRYIAPNNWDLLVIGQN